MSQKYFIGIDVSKNKLDFAVIDFDMKVLLEEVIKNDEARIGAFLRKVIRKVGAAKDEVYVCCETTGIYGRPLQQMCSKMKLQLWVEHAVKIKKATTDMRGKSDKQDALRIAQYACRYRDRFVAFQEPSDIVKQLRALVAAREDLLEKKVSLDNQLGEAKTHDPELFSSLRDSYKVVLKTLDKQLKVLEQKIDKLADSDAGIKKNRELLMTIDGVGKQTATLFIVHTDNFARFDSAKHLACYAGVVPFANESGMVVKKKRVSKQANMKLKKVLHMAAMAAIRSRSELKGYFLRKVKEGKNKMSVLNAIRNKIVHRIFAVITRQTPYERKPLIVS